MVTPRAPIAGPVPGQVWRLESPWLDEVEERLKPLDVSYAQLTCGPLRTRAEGVFLDNTLVGITHHDAPVQARGMVLADALIFQHSRSLAPVSKGNVPIAPNAVVLTRPNADIDFAGRAPLEALTIAVQTGRWLEVAQALGVEAAAAVPPNLIAFDCLPQALCGLYDRARWVLRAADVYPNCFARRDIRRVAEPGIIRSVMALLECSRRCIEAMPAAGQRREAVARVETYLKAHLAEPLSLADLCRIAGLKARALQYAFDETLGVTPMRYVKMARLSRAQHLLRTANPGTTTVTSVAYEAGFWHLAQFAQDYRVMFGELPSATLRRCR